MSAPRLSSKLAGWTAVFAVAAIAIAVVLLRTDFGAGILGRLRCASLWVTTDAAAYRACADFEREQMLEQRRHTPED
jgi:hypothetical protein